MGEVTGTLSQTVTLNVDLDQLVDLSQLDARLTAVENRTDDDLDDAARELIANAQGQIVVMQAEILTLRSALAAEQTKVDDDDDEEARAAVAAAETKIATLQSQVLRLEQSSGGGSTAVVGNDISLTTILPLGGTDNARMDAALAAQKADPRRVIRLDYRDEGRTFTKTNLYDHAVQIDGPCGGFQNPEQTGAGGRSSVKIKVNVGTGVNSWFVGTKTVFNVCVRGLVIQSDNANSQFWHHPYAYGGGSGYTLYGGYFQDITLYGFKHGFGTPGDAMSITLCHFAGQMQFPGIKDTAISLRGADSWWTAKTNLDGILGGGKYHIRLENLSKSHMSGLYATARDATRVLYNEGGSQGGMFVHHMVIEGHNAGDPAYGTLVVNKAGLLILDHCAMNFSMEQPGQIGTEATEIDLAAGVVVLGGIVDLGHISYAKASGVAATVPFAHVAAGATLYYERITCSDGSANTVSVASGGAVNPNKTTVVNV